MKLLLILAIIPNIVFCQIDIRDYGATPDNGNDCSIAANRALLRGDIIISNGVFTISSSIKIPSNRTVYIQNATIIMDTASYDNFFRNSDFNNGNENIHIIGLGNAILDANTVDNTDTYATHGRTDDYSYKYVGIQIYNVNIFSIKNLFVSDMNHHLMHLSRATNGEITKIKTVYRYPAPNKDCIDITWGSSDIIISDISGYSSDDFLALFVGGVAADFMPSYETGYNVGDIYNITVDNILIKNSIAGRCPAIIAGNGNKIHDITLTNLNLMKSGAIFFSNYTSYEGIAPGVDDIYNITIDTAVVGQIYYDQSVFEFGESMKNSEFTNITNNSGLPIYRIINGTINNVNINETAVE